MTTQVTYTELRSNLKKYLDMAEKGKTVLVVRKGKITRIGRFE